MTAKLSKEARKFFAEKGREGGLKGDPEKKKHRPEMAQCIAELNRTRRVVAEHEAECTCAFCVRYRNAKARIEVLKEESRKVREGK